MRARTRAAAILLAATLAVGLAACVPEHVDRVVPGTELTIAQTAPVTSLNPAVLGQDTAADAGLAALTGAGFWRQDAGGERVAQPEFGRVHVDGEDPLTLTYTINREVRWSDGVPVDAADLLLAWAAGTTHRTGSDSDAEGLPRTRWGTGAGAGWGLDLVSRVPAISADRRSVTLVFDSPVADAETLFDVPAVPAHGVTMLGRPGEAEDPEAAKSAFIAAVQDGDLDWLAPVSRAFREGYVLDDELPETARITNGPYAIDAIDEEGTEVTLRANTDFAWGPSPVAERLTVRAVPDPRERVRAVVSGEVDIAASAATAELVGIAARAGGHSVAVGTAFEHIDLQTAGGGVFDPAAYGGDVAKAHAVREAFLATVPRAALLAELVAPLTPDAEPRDSAVRAPSPVAPDAGEGAADTSGAASDRAEPADPSRAREPDIDRAVRLLADAKVVDPVVRMLVPADDPRRAAAAETIADSAAEAGITVETVVRSEWTTVLTDRPEDYDAAVFAWDADPSAPIALAAGFHTAAAQNAYGWSDDRVDALVSALGAERDETRRAELLAELDAAVTDQAWTLPLFDLPVLTVWSDAVGGVPASSTADALLRGYPAWSPAGGAGAAALGGAGGTGYPARWDSVSER